MPVTLQKYPDIAALRALYKNSTPARRLLDRLSEMAPNTLNPWHPTDLSRHAFSLSHAAEIIEVFRGLEACGCGVYNASYPGTTMPGAFEWSFESGGRLSVSLVARGNSDVFHDHNQKWECPVCGHDSHHMVYGVRGIRIFECRGCTVQFSDAARFNTALKETR